MSAVCVDYFALVFRSVTSDENSRGKALAAKTFFACFFSNVLDFHTNQLYSNKMSMFKFTRSARLVFINF